MLDKTVMPAVFSDIVRKEYEILSNLFRNLKPHWKGVIVIALLLMIQAFCDLAMPQYTSEMIDTGIQHKGVTSFIPAKVTEETYDGVQIFMNDEEKDKWQSLYRKSGGVYELRAIDKEQVEDAEQQLLLPIVSMFQSQKDGGLKSHVGNLNAYVKEMRSQGEKSIESLGPDMVRSMAIVFAVEADKAAGLDVDSIQRSYLFYTGGRLFLMALIMLLTATLVAYFASSIGAAIGRDLREKLFSTVMSYSKEEIDQFSTASLITRTTNDVQQVQLVSVLLLRMVLYAPIIGVGGIYKVHKAGANMGWLIGLGVLAVAVTVFVLMAMAMPRFKKMQGLVDNLNLVSREILTGIPVIRAFTREEFEEKRFDKASVALQRNQLFTSRIMTMMMPLMFFIMYTMIIAITWVSAHRIDGGTLQVGSMTAFITYSMLIVMAFLMLAAMSIILPRAGVAAGRINEVINTKTSINNPENPVIIDDFKGEIAFENVSFRYPNAKEDAISNISFQAAAGETVAIIGSTGSGKSTIVNLISRFYDATCGSVKLDGVDVRQLELRQLRRQVALAPQKATLFTGTVKTNLQHGNSLLTEDQLIEILDVAQASQMIEEDENGIHKSVAQGGSNLSGGQRQRLAIAMALSKKSKIMIFDDSFSALDMKTDQALRKRLEEFGKDSTKIIVGQRISTIRNADKILVLDDGKLVGQGTHSELLKTSQVYREIALSQMSEEEVN